MTWATRVGPRLVFMLAVCLVVLPARAQTDSKPSAPASPATRGPSRTVLVRIDAAEWAREDLLDRLNYFGADHGLQFSSEPEQYLYQIIYDFGQQKIDSSVFVLGPGCKTVELAGKKEPCESGAPFARVSVFDAHGALLFEVGRAWGGVDAVAKDLVAEFEGWNAKGLVAEVPPEMPLKMVSVNASRISCVFHPECLAVPEDTPAKVSLPGGGTGILHSMVLRGAGGSLAAGLYGYQYRLEVEGGQAGAACLSELALEFGPVIRTVDYRGDRTRGNQLFIQADSRQGAVGLASAVQRGGKVTVRFASPLCASQSSVVFGLASENPPGPAAAIEVSDAQGHVLAAQGILPRH